jgi:hypothetical protein
MGVAALFSMLLGCSSALRTVPFGPPSNAANGGTGGSGASGNLVPVDLAPPPAKIESIPLDPGEPCGWLDGHWEYRARTWEWTAGDWVVPPDGCHYSPPQTVWVATTGLGQLFYIPGQWYPSDSGGKCGPTRSCTEASSQP